MGFVYVFWAFPLKNDVSKILRLVSNAKPQGEGNSALDGGVLLKDLNSDPLNSKTLSKPSIVPTFYFRLNMDTLDSDAGDCLPIID